MNRFSLLTITLLFCSFAVFAHGPVRQKMTKTIEINAPAAKVWEVIGNFADLSWLTVVESVKTDAGNNIGAVRVITLKNGGTIKEELIKYDATKMAYKYKITEMSTVKTVDFNSGKENVPVLPVSDYAATISVASKDDKNSVVTWQAGYYRAYMNNLKPGELPEMNNDAANKAVEDLFIEGLNNIKVLLEK
jgi:hypothetical protein